MRSARANSVRTAAVPEAVTVQLEPVKVRRGLEVSLNRPKNEDERSMVDVDVPDVYQLCSMCRGECTGA